MPPIRVPIPVGVSREAKPIKALYFGANTNKEALCNVSTEIPAGENGELKRFPCAEAVLGSDSALYECILEIAGDKYLAIYEYDPDAQVNRAIRGVLGQRMAWRGDVLLMKMGYTAFVIDIRYSAERRRMLDALRALLVTLKHAVQVAEAGNNMLPQFPTRVDCAAVPLAPEVQQLPIAERHASLAIMRVNAPPLAIAPEGQQLPVAARDASPAIMHVNAPPRAIALETQQLPVATRNVSPAVMRVDAAPRAIAIDHPDPPRSELPSRSPTPPGSI